VIPQLQTQITRPQSSFWRPMASTIIVLTEIVHYVYGDFALVFEKLTRLEMYNTAIVFWTLR
jgi:hypothetical protein